MKFHTQAHFFSDSTIRPLGLGKNDIIQCDFTASPMPTWAKTLLVASETPCTNGVEIKAEYASGG